MDDLDARRARRRASRAATVAAFAAVIAAPLLAGALATGSPAALIGLPAESIAVMLVLLAVGRPGLRLLIAGAFGVAVVAAASVAALNAGFEATIDRPFRVIEDLPAVVAAIGVVRDATGPVIATVAVVVIVAALAAAAAALAAAALRARSVTERAGRSGRIAITAITAVWILGTLAGAQVLPGVPLAAADSTAVLVSTTTGAAQSLRDEERFQRALASDPLRGAAGLLDALQGKDVIVAFVESYGRVALEHPPFAGGVATVLQQGGAQLARDGYSARSAFLTSPTFGGVSWLAHSTLQSGAWVDSQQKYDRLTSVDRLTLTRMFSNAGWRTVAVVPSNTEPWPVGTSFYGYDAILNAQNMGYAGPSFGYARIPDQYTWKRFYDRELSGPHEPLMAEIDLVSSHTPWTPLPRLVPWATVGDGSIFEAQAAEGPSALEVWADPGRVQTMYGQSVQYTLRTMFSYLHAYDHPDLVLVVLGDHQPARIVSGREAGRDVPVTIISKDPAVFERIASWRWEVGVHPSPTAPVWRMDEFRDRFVGAFTEPPSLVASRDP